MKTTPAFLFGAAATALVGVAIVIGFAVTGSPATIRAQRFDDARSENLRDLSNEITSYHLKNEKLPESLVALSSMVNTRVMRDPDTGVDYGYNVTGPHTYQLCAVFQAISDDNPRQYYVTSDQRQLWNHGAGQKCFDLKVSSLKKEKP